MALACARAKRSRAWRSLRKTPVLWSPLVLPEAWADGMKRSGDTLAVGETKPMYEEEG
jgi:hypothetical protein